MAQSPDRDIRLLFPLPLATIASQASMASIPPLFVGMSQDFDVTIGQVGQVRASAELLTGYLDAVQARTVAYLGGLSNSDLDRVVDANWDPPVTLGVRLVSVADDDLEHAAQASFVRGVLDRR